MRCDYFQTSNLVFALALILQPPKSSPLSFVKLNGSKRQNDVCLNHSPGEFAKNPNDCRSFYLCMDNGQTVLAPCPPTMLFNPVSKLCDTAANVNCDVDIPPNGTNNINNENHNGNELQNAAEYCASQSAEQDRIIFVGSSTDCHRYFICYYGRAVLQECSVNLHWNVNTAKCDLPKNAGCSLWNNGNSISTIAPTATGSDIDNLDGDQTMDEKQLINCPIYGQHIFPHMSRCDLFIYCVKGYAIQQQCPFYYNFDIVSKTCKWRTAAICIRDLNINIRKAIDN